MLSKKALLVLDCFREHLTKPNASCEKYEPTWHLLWEGLLVCWSHWIKCQPAIQSVNRPFKVAFRQQYMAWMASATHEKTTTGGLNRAPLATVSQWIASTRDSVSFDVVLKSFKVTGISNNLGSTEDDLEGAPEGTE